ncbi:MAG TPA: helix-turn-helix transcriptional regulator [Chitinophagales bacterium]|nr:helix-turn-helix transcriptional regulator [Chitinophagales bacterium]
MNDFGKIIAYERKVKGITQIELADMIEVSRRTIQLLENNNSGRIDILWRCIIALDIKEMSFIET